jgi:adenine deaminase
MPGSRYCDKVIGRVFSAALAGLVRSADMPDSALARRIAVARGDEPADLVVRGGRVLSVFTREWLEVDIAVADGYVAGLGDYEGAETLDASGRYVIPGFVDAHMHLETTKLLPDALARLLLPLGVTAVVADPHEIANVLGTDGVHWLLDVCAELPLDVYFMAPSCVPASAFESPRRPLSLGDLEGLLRRRRMLGLAEMMNFPGVIAGDDGELAKLALPGALHVDGHAAGVTGHRLQAYAAAGIRSDHEAVTVEEGRERLRAGMWLLVREASGARNLETLLALVREYGPARIAFCTDDREPEHIAGDGHVNAMVRQAVAAGITPEDAIVMATLNPASWHGLHEHGAIAPGCKADLLLLEDLELFVPSLVLKNGLELGEIPRAEVPDWVRHTVRIGRIGSAELALERHGSGPVRVIGIVPDQIVTEQLEEEPTVRNGRIVADPERDLAKVAVVERHLGTGRVGTGLVRGYGLRSGAIATTVAHDAHNLVAVGVDDDDILRAVQRLAELGGGVVVVEHRDVRAELPLPVAGLLTTASAEEAVAATEECLVAARELGCTLNSPFQTLSFLALSVIPALKITDRGLVDVDRFELVPLEVA